MALVVDPNLEMVPDFASNLYAGIRTDLKAATNQTGEEVIACLMETWNADHNARVVEWNQDREAEARREAEAERERTEAEKKKPKMNGFEHASSVGDYLTPCPAQYAIQKLTNFEYVELWYFLLEGCKDALKSSHSVADNDMSITRTDDQLTLWPTSAFKVSKVAMADHELSFSIFLRAKNLFLVQISKAKWPQPNIDALLLFFWHLENHSIRNNSEIGDMVILTYALRVHQDWHDCLKCDEGFNIGNINENLIWTINEELWDKVRSCTSNIVCTQSKINIKQTC
ncbi:uncharacterized protein BJ212DRAFT_1478000 [Suillus subaureus]|uniref:Uncharacterized protein n=1 Tax=Suillus subaureus TaxID=48587 RepID=A0A9P7EGS6_9AGAM|nr:uncharacterized protein BJ212DRAFT_1478000 [Suillus subaureus]KAG1820907.1 hypothetical protein BJ212DRAFT_1478000 [Suillus subaureus]